MQTIGPLCVEVAGLKQLPSLLALSWLSVVLPLTCKLGSTFQRVYAVTDLISKTTVSEAIALELRRPGHTRAYLYPQIFCGLCYVLASFCLWITRVIIKRRD